MRRLRLRGVMSLARMAHLLGGRAEATPRPPISWQLHSPPWGDQALPGGQGRAEWALRLLLPPCPQQALLTSTVVTVPPPGIYRVLGVNSASTLARPACSRGTPDQCSPVILTHGNTQDTPPLSEMISYLLGHSCPSQTQCLRHSQTM